MLKIGNLELKNNVILAPMASISNPTFIKIVEEMGCPLAYTELLSSEAIVRDNKKTFDLLNGLDKINIPVGVQIFGNNPKTMAESAKILVDKFNIKLIDINMGCPVPKVAIKNNAGSALLKNPNLIKEIVGEVVSNVNVPVTVKIRSGWDESSINAIEIAKIIEESGASAITVHARTRSQGYSGKSDWNIIKQVKECVSIPVIGNGDVTTPELAKEMLDITNCDAVMIGRGVLGNPWLIKNTIEYLNTGHYENNITIEDKINMLKKHFELLIKNTNERVAMLEIRSHALWYLKGINGCAIIKNKICSAKNVKEIFNILDDFKGDINGGL